MQERERRINQNEKFMYRAIANVHMTQSFRIGKSENRGCLKRTPDHLKGMKKKGSISIS